MITRILASGVGGALALFFLASAAASSGEDGEQIVRAMTEAINSRQLDQLDSLVSEHVLRHSAATPGPAIESLDQFKAFLEQDFVAVPDSHQEITHIFSSDDLVAARVIYRGTQSGPWGPFPASGKQLELPFIGILRIEEGKIAEIWVEWDNLNALMQLGHIENPPADTNAK